MTYKEILEMISSIADYYFYNSLKDDGIQKAIIECATKIYIKQMELEKEKLQQEYDELLEESNRKSNEPVERRQTLADWIKEKEEEKNAEE